MKVCFVCLDNLMKLPYLYKYTDLMNCKYDIIYWNRMVLEERCGAEKYYPFSYFTPPHSMKTKKLFGYLKFKRYATKILKENNYSLVVLLNSTVAILLNEVLLSKYKGRYVIDIRDYSYEHIKYFYLLEDKLIHNANSCVISSPGYEEFLPQYDYYLVHNFPKVTEEGLKQYQRKREKYNEERRKKNKVAINLTYIGDVRFIEQDKKVLRYFGNDDRFCIRYIGLGTEVLKEFCEEEKIKNTYFRGMFKPNEIFDYYVEADAVLNLYGNNTPLLDYALSNKLYFAALLSIPILVCSGTYMEKISKQYGFGYTIDFYNGDVGKNDFMKFYMDLDRKKLKQGCDLFIEKVQVDEKRFNLHFRNLFKELEEVNSHGGYSE